VQQGAAVIAAPLLSAERFGPASDDVGDGATMRWQHRRTMNRQIAVPETAENVCHFGHASEAAHHLVEQLAQGCPRRLRQVRVNRRGGDVLVAEKHLNDAGVDLPLEQARGIGVAQRVRRGTAAAGKIGRLYGIGEGTDQDVGRDGTGSRTVGEKPATIAMVLRQPDSPQVVVHRPRYRDDAFLVALADDPQQAAGFVDGGDRKTGGLADPQAAAIDQAETAAMYGIADRGEDAPHFGMGKRLQQPPLLGKPDLFLNSAQSWPNVFR